MLAEQGFKVDKGLTTEIKWTKVNDVNICMYIICIDQLMTDRTFS